MLECPKCENSEDLMIIGYSITWCPCGCVFGKGGNVLVTTPPFFDEGDLHKGSEHTVTSIRGQKMVTEFTPLQT